MSRFSGPQADGAARRLQAQRRLEAEARQREEAERDRARAAYYAAEEEAGRPLTDDEIAALVEAALRINPAGLLDRLRRDSTDQERTTP